MGAKHDEDKVKKEVGFDLNDLDKVKQLY